MKKMGLYLLGISIIFGAGFWLGRGDWSTKVVQTDEKKSEQTTKVVEKIIEKPSGERVIYRTIRDDRKETVKKEVVTVDKTPKWILGLSYGADGFRGPDQVYTLSLDRKVLGGAYIGLYGTSRNEYGIGLKYTF